MYALAFCCDAQEDGIAGLFHRLMRSEATASLIQVGQSQYSPYLCRHYTHHGQGVFAPRYVLQVSKDWQVHCGYIATIHQWHETLSSTYQLVTLQKRDNGAVPLQCITVVHAVFSTVLDDI